MDYRELIRAEFARRRSLDMRYSLRQFARDMGLKPMHLCYVLRGERGLSKENSLRVASVLGLRAGQAQRFKFIVSAQSGRSRRERNLAQQALRRWAKQDCQK